MTEKYRVVNNQLEIYNKDFTHWRHKYLVYIGSFYVKTIDERDGKMVIDLLEGDMSIVEYRDSIHDKRVGWKMPLVELIVSYMKVAYLISKGVIYVPFSNPKNLIYNENTTRVQIGGRYDDTLGRIDEDFLWWVIEMIGFIISDVDASQFGTLTINEYYEAMDKEHRDLYEGYLRSETFEDLIEYTLEKSIIDVLNEYSPITNPPINDVPKLRDILAESTELFEKRQAEQRRELEERRAKEERIIQEKQEKAEIKDDKQSFVNKIFGTIGIKSRKKADNKPRKVEESEYEEARRERKREQQAIQQHNQRIEAENNRKKKRRRGNLESRTERYRGMMGIPEDIQDINRRRKGTQILPTIMSLLTLAGVLYLVYQFYIYFL